MRRRIPPPGTSDSVIHSEALSSHSSSRSPTTFTNSLGQTRATANMGDLAELLTSMAKGQNTVAPGHSKVVTPKYQGKALDVGSHSGNSDYCKVFDVNGLDKKYITSILIRTPGATVAEW